MLFSSFLNVKLIAVLMRQFGISPIDFGGVIDNFVFYLNSFLFDVAQLFFVAIFRILFTVILWLILGLVDDVKGHGCEQVSFALSFLLFLSLVHIMIRLFLLYHSHLLFPYIF